MNKAHNSGEDKMQVSFKAKFEGLDSLPLQILFERQTQDDKTHTVRYIPNKDKEKFAQDKFVLLNNGKETAEYVTHVDPKYFWIKRLLQIYDLLIEKENQK